MSETTELNGALMFTKHSKRQKIVQEVSLFGKAIPWRTEAKYMGLILDKGLIWCNNFTYALSKAKLTTTPP